MVDTGMTKKHCETLSKCRVQFVKDLNPEKVLDHLIADSIFTPDDQEDIAARKTRSDKVRFILDLLPQRSDKAFYCFKKALKDEDSGHQHLYQLLDKTLDDISLPSSVQATDGAVPSQQTLTEPLRNELSYQATDGAVQMEHAHSKPQSCTRSGHGTAEHPDNEPEHPDSIVTEVQLGTLAENIFEEWERLGLKLGLSRNDIYRFKMENQLNAWSQIHSMLVKWRNREYRKATIGVLIKKCKEADIAREKYEFLMNPQ